MAKKTPYYKFYPADWRANTCMCSPATRGFWRELIDIMNENDRTGSMSGTFENFARAASCLPHEAEAAIKELQEQNIADVIICNGNVTIICRRIKNEEKERFRVREAVKRSRDKNKCNALPRAVQSYSDINKENIIKENGSVTIPCSVIGEIEKTVKSHPKYSKPIPTQKAAVDAVKRLFDKGKSWDEAVDILKTATQNYADATSRWPADQKRFIMASLNWYEAGCYHEDPQGWERTSPQDQPANNGDDFDPDEMWRQHGQ